MHSASSRDCTRIGNVAVIFIGYFAFLLGATVSPPKISWNDTTEQSNARTVVEIFARVDQVAIRSRICARWSKPSRRSPCSWTVTSDGESAFCGSLHDSSVNWFKRRVDATRRQLNWSIRWKAGRRFTRSFSEFSLEAVTATKLTTVL